MVGAAVVRMGRGVVRVTMGTACSVAAQGGVAVVVQVLCFGLDAVFAAVAFEHRPGFIQAGGAGIEQRENAGVEAEVGAEGKAYLRVLLS